MHWPRHAWFTVLVTALVLSAARGFAQEVQPEPVEQQPVALDDAASAETDQGQAEQQQDVKQLREQMLELERQLREMRQELRQRDAQDRQQVEEAGIKRVEQVVLPETPTREQCEVYIEKLRQATAGRRSFPSTDPVIEKLRAIPPQHLDLLMIEIDNRTSLRIFANYAMRGLDLEQMRQRIVASLDTQPNRIGMIVANGWCEDVRPVIMQHIQNADATLLPAWFHAAVEIAEPDLYPKLHDITTNSRYAIQFINMLKVLPDYDLNHTIEVCWARASEGKFAISQVSLAPLAAEQGSIDALGALIAQLRHSPNYMSNAYSYNPRRINVLRFIDFRGSNDEIGAWFEASREQLVFDFLRKRFVLPEQF